ncbi:hypothetical protein CC85DRAFT_47450 [Cutaneotrichosporon oleaginosum]|uniref:Uncharacterized protein n=1 Tax=Cutaneotrichosporon oleaginosum TaxID=879819 RepID=A0A0J0XQW6_9TREE|nr:uncharacterized protein CC85DRAFT_47450 [Cutaneotrichosporon oleaginosum]KLT43470.1 hypothetical protein CC85DRAFT_47450 [Cutaneotrichosporon oleaginosum]TXT05625.1 hypothetical protein COLE_06945 [Cutaneotrichosporon oleaginosum]
MVSAHAAMGARWQCAASGRMWQSLSRTWGWRWIWAMVATISWPGVSEELECEAGG